MDKEKNMLTNTLDHLPEEKKQALSIIKELICKEVEVEMVILFGSHATGKQVEDSYVKDGITYSYTSDYDILVVTPNRRSYGDWVWGKIGDKIRRDPRLGPTTIIHHSINFFNEKIRDQYYFFTDIYREGVILHDSKRYQLDRPQELSPEKRKQKAEMYLGYWTKKANASLKVFKYCLEEEEYNEAAFNLHQAVERYYAAFLLVFTDYRPKTHDIETLGVMASKVEAALKDVFPCISEEEKYRFELLKRAYTDARYEPDYSITPEELNYLSERILLLRELVEKHCQEEIERLTAAIRPKG